MPLVILDRDGVINVDSAEYIKSPDEWTAIPGSLEAIAQLNRLGFQVAIITNQSGVGRGYYNLETLDQIHEKLMDELAAVGGYIDEIFFCPHLPTDLCECRKPQPGLFYKAEKQFQINLKDVFYIGDSYVDMQVAKAAGCKPLLVLTGNGQKTLQEHPELSDIPTFENLSGAVKFIVEQTL
jgi:D-glycero-D-manno-heptose 1,7-bisphosphate phosphatase